MLLPKTNIIRDKKWIEHVRQLPCIVTGKTPCDPSHIRYGLGGGMGMKPSDDMIVPLDHHLHALSHQHGELGFWLKYLPENPDTLMRCLKAYAREQYREYREGK